MHVKVSSINVLYKTLKGTVNLNLFNSCYTIIIFYCHC